ncbi:uncharacterized protein [Primulina huaijiensis]|uniref:uncharacterized protein n=1 Tax=Primulina huaijiensis TaxID=1492673 RepID=UPI003CC72662
MVESNDHCKDFKTTIEYPVYSRKRRQLMPRMASISSSTGTVMSGNLSANPTPACYCKHHSNILAGAAGYDALPLVSTRWNPTPEQLQVLEEMYRRGIRTPTAEQIRQIAGRLRRFGKIEGKNVFYWFQNHKARERQKKRRQLELLSAKQMDCVEPKEPGFSKKYMQSEHAKKLGGPSKCGTPSEGSVSKHRAVESERETVGLMTHFELNLQQKTAAKNNEICCNLDLSSCMFPTPISAQKNYAAQENENPFCALNLSIPSPSKNDDLKINFEDGIQVSNRILQLFPVGSINDCKIVDPIGEEEAFTRNYGTEFKFNYEFFEFLPTKN